MPTYEYECKKCGPFEQFQRITEGKLKKCPTCKGSVKRLLGSGAGIIFKGSGFYQTDYRSESYKRGSKSDTAAGASPASSPSSSSTSSSSGSNSTSGSSSSSSGAAGAGKAK